MEQHKEALQSIGLQLICVGLGETHHAERYCGKLAPSQTCFASTSNDPYYAWGIYQFTNRDTLRNVGKLISASGKAILSGQTQGQATGDTQMSSGTFIVDKDGKVAYAYYSKVAGDDPEIAELLEVTRRLKAGS